MDGRLVTLVDSPGMYDTNDTNSKNKEPESLILLKNSLNFFEKNFNSEIHIVLLCYNCTNRFGFNEENIFYILTTLTNISRVCLCVTYAQLKQFKKKRETLKKEMDELAKKYGFFKVFYFENKIQNEEIEALWNTISGCNTFNVKTIEKLQSEEKKQIQEKT